MAAYDGASPAAWIHEASAYSRECALSTRNTERFAIEGRELHLCAAQRHARGLGSELLAGALLGELITNQDDRGVSRARTPDPKCRSTGTDPCCPAWRCKTTARPVSRTPTMKSELLLSAQLGVSRPAPSTSETAVSKDLEIVLGMGTLEGSRVRKRARI